MKNLLYLTLFVVWVFWASDCKVSFSPFSISFKGWLNMVGWLFLIIGLVVLNVDQFSKGEKKGRQDVIRMLYEDLDIKE